MKKIKLSTIALILILLSYTIISFYKLGNFKNPVTYVNVKDKEKLFFEIDSELIPTSIMVYGANAESKISVSYAEDYKKTESYVYDSSFDIEYSQVFSWQKRNFSNNSNKYKYLILESNLDSSTIGEIQVYDYSGKTISLIPMGDREKLLLDEQELVPTEYDHMNSSYFDEIYFPRASYEIMHKLSIFEYVHPPLGKLIISIPIHFFGVTPFAYRLPGNIAGILMILVIYHIAKLLFKRERYALFAAVIMALDGMHFVQTRIGTVDSFLVLFNLTSFMFFLKYINIPSEKPLKNKMLPLLLSGIFWGMALSVKWTSCFIGLGMGIIYFVKFIKNKKLDIKLLAWSVLCFVIIPIGIYVASYIPVINDPNAVAYYKEKDETGKEVWKSTNIHDIKTFFIYQEAIYRYHSELDATHPYASSYVDWPIMKRPIWYYIARFEDGSVGTIACMGNPAIWWLSIGTAIFTLIYTIIKRNREGAILLVMILATWLPYAKIGRIMYLYHYFITLPFMMLTIVFTIARLAKWKKQIDYIIPILTIVFLCFFIYFYPIYSGKPVNIDYIKETEWLDTWEYDGLPR